VTRKLPGKLLSPAFERQIRDGLVRAGSAGNRKRRAAGFEGVGPRVATVLAQITGDDGAADASARKYSWEEVRPLAAGGVEAKPNGRTGSAAASTYAQEPNGEDVDTGTVVSLLRAMRDDGTMGWVIVGAKPADCVPDPDASVSMDVIVDVTWDEGGNGKLQKVKRTMTVNSCGEIGWGDPVTLDIDTPGDCTT
jgi:hypothetical protein